MPLMRTPEGVAVDVPAEQVQSARNVGYTDTTTELAAPDLTRPEATGEGLGGALLAGGTSLLSGASFGGTDALIAGVGTQGDLAAVRAAREAHPIVSGVSGVVGAIAPAIATGGESLLAAPTRLVGEAGQAAARAGEAAGLGRIGGAVLGGTVEGGLYGAGAGVSELALSQDPLTVEHIASALSSNALYGAALGGGIGALGKGAELGLRRAKGAIDTALEKRALSKAQTPIEAIESGDLQHVDKRILDTAEKAEVERIRAEQAPEREAFTNELDAWRRANRDEHDLREVAKASGNPDISEAGGAFDRANFELRRALDNKIKFTKDPVKSIEAVQRQAQALEEMKAAALKHQQRWQQELADAPAQIRGALDEVEALSAPRPSEVPEYASLRSRLDAGQDYIEQTVSARSLAEHGYYEPPGGGVDKVKAAKARRAIAEGQQEAITLNVTPSGKVIVDDGRHRLAAAIAADKPIRVKWSTAYEEGAGGDMVLRSKSPGGAELLKERIKLAKELGIYETAGAGPWTEAGKEAAAERVLKERMGFHWNGAIKGGLKQPSIVSRLPKIDEMLAANQRLQGQLEALAKPPTSELLTKIADARAVLEGPKPAPSGLGAVVSAVAPFAGPAGAAAAAGGRVIGSFKKLAAAAGERLGKATSTFLSAAIPATKYAVPLATKTLTQVRFGEPDKASKGKEPKTLPELYQARTREVKEQIHIAPDGTYQMRPEARMKLASKFDGIRATDPKLADQLETKGAAKIEYLATIMPRFPDFGVMQIGPDRRQVDDLQMRGWARAVAALEDPHAVLEAAAQGRVTPAAAAAIRAVYPELLAEYTHGVTDKLGGLPKRPHRDKLLALSILTGVPLDAAMTPGVQRVIQGMYASEPGTQGGTQAPTPQPAFGSVKAAPETQAQMRQGENT